MTNEAQVECQMDDNERAGVPQGAKTSDFYATGNLPERFNNPGYGQTKKVNPVYTTTNSNYGSKKPTVHTMPTQFHGKTQKFSEHLGKCGMYRNASFNTGVDKSPY